MQNDKRGWGWMIEGDEEAHGAFDNREEAVSAAIDYLCDDYGGQYFEVMIGRCTPIDKIGYARIVANYDDNLLDVMEDNAYSDISADDHVFYVREADREKARAAWENLVEMWVSAFVYTDLWQLRDEKPETIYIPTDEESVCPSCRGTGKSTTLPAPDSITCRICDGKGYVPDVKLHGIELAVAVAKIRKDAGAVCNVCYGKGVVASEHEGATGYECSVCKPLTESEQLLAETLGCPPILEPVQKGSKE